MDKDHMPYSPGGQPQNEIKTRKRKAIQGHSQLKRLCMKMPGFSRQIFMITSNPDSSIHDLGMIASRMEYITMKHFGHITKFDKGHCPDHYMLQCYKVTYSLYELKAYE